MKKLLVLTLITFLFPALCLAAPVGRISKLNGEVSVKGKKSQSYAKAAAGQQLGEGDWVKTGKDGWVELKLLDNSRITLANDSELELASLVIGKKEKRGIFNLTGGKIRAKVTKLAGQQTDFKVKSPTAVAGVKGTEFLMLTRGHANVFFGNEGTVKIFGSGGEGRPLGPQTMTQTTRGYEPVEPVKVEPDTPLAEAKKIFEKVTATQPPADWLEGDNMPNIIARWNINYGRYLADAGRYQEALQVFQIALDLTTLADIRSEARLQRGTVYGRYINDPQATLNEYLQVLDEYPKVPQAETALFSVGQTLLEMGKKDEAAERFRQYLQQYPDGKHKGNVETLLNQLQNQPPDQK